MFKSHGMVKATRRVESGLTARRKAPENARTIKDSARTGTISRRAARAAVRAVMARRA